MAEANITGAPCATVAVVGGGLAGLAAGTALATASFRVTLFERKPYLGGRASSYEHPGTGEVLDNCQHVLLGCCTSLLDFYTRIDAGHLVRWYDRLNFLQPGGRNSLIGASWLPAPLHSTPSFLAAATLSWRDKLAIARALMALIPGLPEDDGRPFSEWLTEHGQTRNAIEHFWNVVLVSALNDETDRVSKRIAAMVFRDSFLKSARGGRMGVPRVPLTQLYSKAGDFICTHGGSVELRAVVEEFEPVGEAHPKSDGGTTALFASRPGVRLCVNGRPRMFDYAVLAVPSDAAARLLPSNSQSEPLRHSLSRFETSPITGVHLWFDRQITDLDHAVLLDRTIQWMFQKSKILDTPAAPETKNEKREKEDAAGNWKPETGNSYIELVISSSKTLVDKPRQEIIDLAVRELADFFPTVREARLVKATVVKEVHATFSPLPGSDAYRLSPETPWPQAFLAGDWTNTGWPATMEGAVRSGYLAAEALCRTANQRQQFLAPDLRASGFMRLFPR